jgi:hypothetical protein
MLDRIRVFSGNANIDLSRNICKSLGVPLGKASVTTFSDGETRVEESIRRSDYNRHPILRLRQTGQKGRPEDAYHCKTCC